MSKNMKSHGRNIISPAIPWNDSNSFTLVDILSTKIDSDKILIMFTVIVPTTPKAK